MATFLTRVKSFLLKNEAGATAVEYGLLVALIAVAIIATVILVGTNLTAVFDRVQTALGGAA